MPFSFSPAAMRYRGDSGNHLHKMINIITGSVESAVNHLHPRVGITRSAIQTRNVDPSAQKKARHKMMYDLTWMGRNSIRRVYLCKDGQDRYYCTVIL